MAAARTSASAAPGGSSSGACDARSPHRSRTSRGGNCLCWLRPVGLAFGLSLAATAGLIINWFGDWLDGTLARSRSIERPQVGFFRRPYDRPFRGGAVGTRTWLIALRPLRGRMSRVDRLSADGRLHLCANQCVRHIADRLQWCRAYRGAGRDDRPQYLDGGGAAPAHRKVVGAASTPIDLIILVSAASVFVVAAISIRRDARQLAAEDPPHAGS